MNTSQVDALPKYVRIGPFDFEIVKLCPITAHDLGVYGQCSCSLLQISLQRTMPSSSKAIDTFFHEVLHAMYWSLGIEDRDKEERIVGFIATGLTQLHLDNPWLGAWLKKGLT